MDTENLQCREQRALRIYVAIFAYFVLATILAVVAWRGLVADGVGYFLSLLARPRPTTFESSRIFAHIIVQWPLVAALKSGVTDISALLYVHSFGYYYLGPLHLLLCYLILPKEKKGEIIWPLISVCAGSMNAWFVGVTESHVMTFIFWPLVLYMLYGKVEQRIQLIVFLALTCASFLSYETMVVQGVVLAGFAFWRCGQTSQTGERILWQIVAAWYILGVGRAILSILNPRDVINRDGLIKGMFRFAGTELGNLNYPAILSIVALGLIAFLILGRPLRGRAFVGLVSAFAIAGVFTALAPVLAPDSLRPIQQFQARAWIGFLPAGLAIAMMYFQMRNCRPSAIAFERVLIVVAILAFSQITWQNLATAQWSGYIDLYRSELVRHSGFIPYEQSPIAHPRTGIQVIRNLTLGWTHPSMSIALAPGGRVSAIFGAPPGRWRPFDPRNSKELPKLAKYGIDYSAYLRTLKSQ